MKRSSLLRLLPLSIALCAGLAVNSPLVAQSSNGAITGTVADSGGGIVPGVSITATNTATGSSRTAVSNDSGAYRLASLPPGRYDVVAELSGFKSIQYPNVQVRVATDLTLDVTLQLGVEETITVSADAPVIETTRSQISSVVPEEMVANLPTNGRNFLDFALTTPGVTRDTRQGDISFAGQKGTLNSIVVDGANNDNTFFGQALGRTGSGRAPYQFSQDAVKEFQINTNAYSAEYGRAGGAVINVVTKSGTNELHGSSFYFLRDRDFNQNNYFNEINNRPKGPYEFDQFGASVGGPIARDKHFFFLNYDAQRNTFENIVIIGLPATLPTDADTQAGLERVRQLGNSYDRGQDQDVYLLKTDHDVWNSHFSFRFNRQEFTGTNLENGGTTNSFEHTGSSLVETDTFTLGVSTPLGSSMFNELRGQYAKDHEPGLANSANPEATINQGGVRVLTIGRNFFSPRETTIKRSQIADTITFLVANHTLKSGFDYSQDDILNFFPGNFSGSYTFNSLASFNRGRPTGTGERYVQAFAGPGTTGPTTEPNIQETALFVQDEWRITPKVTLNLGLRYDKQGIEQPSVRNPDPQLAAAGLDTSVVPEDDNNIAPRLGVAYAPGGGGRLGRTVFRAGYGVFYGRTPAIMIGTAHSNNGINVQTLTFTGESVPTYPNLFTSVPAGGAAQRPSILLFDPNYENPRVQQGSAGIEHALTNSISVGLSYLYVRGDDLSRSIDINVGTPTLTTLPVTGGGSAEFLRFGSDRPFTNFSRVIAFQSSARSEYNGITLDLNKRFSGNWVARLAYTFSEAMDDKPDQTAVVPFGFDDGKYAQDLVNEFALSDLDVRHRAVLSGVWYTNSYAERIRNPFLRALGRGWTLSGIASFQTGYPYSATINTDLNNDGNSRNDRAPGFERNEFRLGSQFTIDPRVTRDISMAGPLNLQLIIEAFNVLDRRNFNSATSAFYSLSSGQLVPITSFGTYTATADPRIIQLAAKVIF